MKSKIIQCRTLPAFAFAAVLALSGITQSLQAQSKVDDCRAELSAGAKVSPLVAKIGGTITITEVNASVPTLGVCTVAEVSGYIVKPNLNSQLVFNNGFINVAGCWQCPPLVDCANGGNIGSCQAFSATYVIAAADIGKPISGTFTDPAGGSQVLSRSAVPFHVQFMPAAVGRVPAGGNSSGLIAAGNGQAVVRIITPCITITKACVTTCPPGSIGNSRYGQPIQFSGTVCNTGNNGQPDASGRHDLSNITVTDSPAATIVFNTMTSFNTPYNGTLRPGECIGYTGSYNPSGNLCGPFLDTISVTAVDSTGATISNLDPCYTTTDGINYTSSGPRPPVTANCTVCTAPNIDVVKECLTPVVQAGQPAIYRIRVQNTGDVPLQNVVLRDDSFTPGNTADDVVINIPGQLAPGAFFPASGWITNQIITTTAHCAGGGFITNTVVATGQNICPPPQTQTVTDTDRCNVQVLCRPGIRVVKEVVCKEPNVTCENSTGYSKLAKGVRGADDPNCPEDNGCPAFCYRITVSNTGDVNLVTVTLVDNNGTPSNTGDDVSFNIGNLAVGASQTRFYSSTRCNDTHNIVVAEGQSAVDSSTAGHVTATDFADVQVVPISVTCEITLDAGILDMDGRTLDDAALTCKNGGVIGDQAEDSSVRLAAGFAGPVCFNLYLNNPSAVNLSVTVTLNGTLAGIPQLAACFSQPITVPAGATVATSCSLDFTNCPTALNGNVTVKGTALVTGDITCIHNGCGNAVTTATSQCGSTASCETPATCRVTGGGVLLPDFVDQSCISVPTTIFPFTSPNGLTIKKITHGGQLGAPFSQMDCGAILGNPCIRGQWSHTRHYEGTANPRDVFDMNFHSTTPKGVYDSLFCACLGCCDPETGAFIPPSLGPLVHKFQICNPDDHKVCGPMPRPAPANVIIWSGIGKVTPTDDIGGSRAAQQEWVVFRIYIEDRSEPGGGHPGGAVEPADIYCFQAWKTGIKTSKKPDFTTISTAFRAALGQANCDFVNALETGALPIGSLPSPTVNGLTADIQDCGPMHDGNHQIHPSTGATCDQ